MFRWEEEITCVKNNVCIGMKKSYTFGNVWFEVKNFSLPFDS
jgi:hypothetical protein